MRTVAPLGRDDLRCCPRVEALEEEAQLIDGPLIIVAHSGGVITVAHWAQRTHRLVAGALLAVPPDFECRCRWLSDDRAVERASLASHSARAAAVLQHRCSKPQRSARKV